MKTRIIREAIWKADHTIRLWEDAMGRSTQPTRDAKAALMEALKELSRPYKPKTTTP